MNKICINPELDELKEIYDRASEDTYIGKYRGLNLISAHNSTLGVEDKNSIRSSRLPLYDYIEKQTLKNVSTIEK